MARTSRRPSLWRMLALVILRLSLLVAKGVLQAFGVIPMPKPRSSGYWAKDSHGRVEHRVPALSIHEEPPF